MITRLLVAETAADAAALVVGGIDLAFHAGRGIIDVRRCDSVQVFMPKVAL